MWAKACMPCSPWEHKERPVNGWLALLYVALVSGGLLAGKKSLDQVDVGLALVFVSVVTLLLTATGEYLFKFLRNNVIGQTFYWFQDEKNEWHRHKNCPNIPGFFSTNQCFQAETVFKIRQGGWFRRSAVFGKAAKNWGVAYCWDANGDLRLRDKNGNEIGVLSCGEFSSLVKRFEYVGDIFRFIEKTEDSLKEEKRKTETWFKATGQLLTGMKALNTLIKETKQTLGRSRHAQFVRECLEELESVTLETDIDEMIGRWRQKLGLPPPKPQPDQPV